MRKPERLGQNLSFLLLFGCLAAVWYFFELPCIPRLITGIPCPACGMTRAWLALFRLDPVSAFRHHPMFWCVPVLCLYIIFDGRLFRRPSVNTWVLGGMLAGLFLLWIARLFGFLGGLSPL